ncbi:MAG TPA: hypothetical protein VH813_04945 [Candidatus Limnocylindrales bacterium]|jgi:hypothetical protein
MHKGLRRRALILASFLVASLFASAVTVSASTFECTGTWFFASAGVGTVFEEGDAWQGATFTFIEDDNVMRVRAETNGDVVGRFPMGFLLGDRATIEFAAPVRITGILWHDNDPNPGEAGWSVNGIAGPLTGDGNGIITPVNLVTDTLNVDAGGDSGGIDFCVTPVRLQGCTPGYWKNHIDSWTATGFASNQTLESVFNVPDSLGMDNVTLVSALGGGGGPGLTGAAKILFRAGVASLLNTAHPGVAFAGSPASVIADVNAALASGSRSTMLDLATELDNANNAGCPLN